MTKAMSKPADFVSLELELTKIPSPGDGELWLLPGSRQVLQLESLLTTAQSTPDPGGLLGHYVGAFHAVLKRMSAQANLDIIFVDCSPSCGKALCDVFRLLQHIHGVLMAVSSMKLGNDVPCLRCKIQCVVPCC